MRISGFSFVRNAILLDYPVREAICSALPLCDEFIVAVGNSDDDTRELVKSINSPKLRILDTQWDNSLREGGIILSQQTNIAMKECSGDWLIYVQADEVFHEDDYDIIRLETARASAESDTDGLLFRYNHFYGNYDYVGVGRAWYRREIRAFKNGRGVMSVGDAQGFRKSGGVKLRARQTEARVFHYGWVRHPRIQQFRQRDFNRLWHSDEWISRQIPDADEFDYAAYELRHFTDTHPPIMAQRIVRDRSWTARFDHTRLRSKPFLMRLTDFFERKTGIRIGEFKDFMEIR
ncbi:hypothetical protein MASR2M18_07070 [Ignavibacteria bacterium]|nr:glycosyltransferase family 2 protein [Bacteroidota bacterium]